MNLTNRRNRRLKQHTFEAHPLTCAILCYFPELQAQMAVVQLQFCGRGRCNGCPVYFVPSTDTWALGHWPHCSRTSSGSGFYDVGHAMILICAVYRHFHCLQLYQDEFWKTLSSLRAYVELWKIKNSWLCIHHMIFHISYTYHVDTILSIYYYTYLDHLPFLLRFHCFQTTQLLHPFFWLAKPPPNSAEARGCSTI